MFWNGATALVAIDKHARKAIDYEAIENNIYFSKLRYTSIYISELILLYPIT